MLVQVVFIGFRENQAIFVKFRIGSKLKSIFFRVQVQGLLLFEFGKNDKVQVRSLASHR